MRSAEAVTLPVKVTIYIRPLKDKPNNIYQKSVYICNGRRRINGIAKCSTKQVPSEIMEGKVWEIAETVMMDPELLKKNIPALEGRKRNAKLRLKRQLTKLDKSITQSEKQRERIIDLYSQADLDKDVYLERNRELEETIKDLNKEKQEVTKTLFILDNQSKIQTSIEEYCKKTRSEYKKCADFLSKRKFISEHVQKVVHDEQDNVFLHGLIPIETENYKANLEFRVKKIITRRNRWSNRGLLPSSLVV